jgi:hypothetical protein
LNPVGIYEWRDQIGEATGCLVRIFEVDGRYEGWIRQDGTDDHRCQWHEADLDEIRVSGPRLRMRIECTALTSRCPQFRLEAVSPTVLEGRFTAAYGQPVTFVLRTPEY